MSSPKKNIILPNSPGYFKPNEYQIDRKITKTCIVMQQGTSKSALKKTLTQFDSLSS